MGGANTFYGCGGGVCWLLSPISKHCCEHFANRPSTYALMNNQLQAKREWHEVFHSLVGFFICFFFFFFFDGWGDFFPPVSIKPHEIAPSLSQHIHQPTDSGNIPAQKFYWKSHASHRDFTHGPSRVFRLRGGRGIKSLLSWDPYDEPMIQTGF